MCGSQDEDILHLEHENERLDVENEQLREENGRLKEKLAMACDAWKFAVETRDMMGNELWKHLTHEGAEEL